MEPIWLQAGQEPLGASIIHTAVHVSVCVSEGVRVSQLAGEQQHGQTDGTLQEMVFFSIPTSLYLERRGAEEEKGRGLWESTKLNTKIGDRNPNQRHDNSLHTGTHTRAHSFSHTHTHTGQDGSSVEHSSSPFFFF